MTYRQALEIPVGSLVTSKTTGEIFKIIDKEALPDGKTVNFKVLPEGTPKIEEIWNHKHACLLRNY